MTNVYQVVPHRISLVVDDEPSVRKYVTGILENEQFQTVEAENGAQGLRIVQELGGDVALVVSDIQMSGGDGLTFVRSVRKAHPAVPVVLMSGQATPDDGFEFVRKPFLPEALVKAVERVMGPEVKPPVFE